MTTWKEKLKSILVTGAIFVAVSFLAIGLTPTHQHMVDVTRRESKRDLHILANKLDKLNVQYNRN